jgi:N-acetylmuramic acid 6-phosphate etherase
MVLNMISTVAMIRLGYVKGNRMTNVKSSNIKLKERSLRILMAETNLEEDNAKELLESADWDLRVALVAQRSGVPKEIAVEALENTNFIVEVAVESLRKSNR